jgi:CTP synthase (UTP-ammonia lyase)
MADALSLSFLDALVARLRAITKAGGYRSDLGAWVSIEDDYTSVTDKPVTYIGIESLDSDTANSTPQQRKSGVRLVIEIAVPIKGRVGIRDIHNAIADVRDALPDNVPVLPDMVTGFQITGSQVHRRPEGFSVNVGQVTARAILIERPSTAQQLR